MEPGPRHPGPSARLFVSLCFFCRAAFADRIRGATVCDSVSDFPCIQGAFCGMLRRCFSFLTLTHEGERQYVNLQHDRHVLVVVGGWNPSIVLNPNWLKKYLFPEDEKFEVQVAVGPGQLPTPCVTVGDIRISLPGSRLCFSLTTPAEPVFDPIQDLACKLADYLPHTPVSSYGVNFVFSAPLGERSFLNQDTVLYKTLATRESIIEEHSRYSLRHGDAVLNLTAKETQASGESGKNLELDFNFHHTIDDLSKLKAGLDERSIQEHFVFARELADNIEQRASEAPEGI